MAGGAAAYRMLGELEKAGDYYRESIAIREDLMHKDASNNLVRRSLMIIYGNYTSLLGNPWSPNLGRPAEARLYGAKCVALAREIVAGDANDITARHDLAMSLSRLGSIDPDPREITESLAQLKESFSLLDPILKANPKSSDTAGQVSLVLEYQGHRLEELGRKEEAAVAYQKSITAIQPFLDALNGSILSQYLASEQSLALLEASSGGATAALGLANHGVSEAERFARQTPHTEVQMLDLARAWSTLGLVQSRVGMTSDARQSAIKAVKLWETIKKPGLLAPFRQTIAETAALSSSDNAAQSR
jgi:tetratricopeptide (TPR) repeat protein